MFAGSLLKMTTALEVYCYTKYGTEKVVPSTVAIMRYRLQLPP
jgi:hypothetical protein